MKSELVNDYYFTECVESPFDELRVTMIAQCHSELVRYCHGEFVEPCLTAIVLETHLESFKNL